MKNVFKIVPVTPQYLWLLSFRWGGKFYKEICFLFGLARTLFIFNLFAEVLHWLIALFLEWMLYHYLDNFVAIFKVREATQEKIIIERKAYI